MIDPAYLDLFVTWHALGGPNNPPTPLELMQWPRELKQAFDYLSRRLNYQRKRRDRRQARRTKSKTAKGAATGAIPK